ncbi:MAG: CubicO group peptidase (beta-lactamase class C family) [Candidatus Azotimanducaceae bacterium]|jgi:CubicO group peptidase (beta-lactamase class C family)
MTLFTRGTVVTFLWVLFAHGALAADLLRAEPESVGMSSERLARIKPFMQRYIDDNKLAGIVTLIARNGKIVHFEKVGKLNSDTGEEIQKDSLLRIYSMTKPIVSVAAMMLLEEGKLLLNKPVANYLPAFKHTKVLVDGVEVPQSHPFTVRELMSHRAGLTYGVFSNTSVDKQYRAAKILGNKDLADMVSTLSKIPLLNQPGTKWVYSVSADVLGRLIEVVSGQPLDEYLASRLFIPLGMNDTFFEVPKDKTSRFGTNHMLEAETGSLTVIDRPETSAYTKEVTFFSGGGGLVSTAADYLRFNQMLLNGGILDGARIISPKTIQIMTTNHLAAEVHSGFGERPGVASTYGFGLGFAVLLSPPLTALGSEGGYTWGGMAGTIFWNDPKEDLTAVLMVQMQRNPYPLRDEFKNLVYQALVE